MHFFGRGSCSLPRSPNPSNAQLAPEMMHSSGGRKDAAQHKDLDEADADHGADLQHGPLIDLLKVRFGQIAIARLVRPQDILQLARLVQLQADAADKVHDVLHLHVVVLVARKARQVVHFVPLRVALQLLALALHDQLEEDGLPVEHAEAVVETEAVVALLGDLVPMDVLRLLEVLHHHQTDGIQEREADVQVAVPAIDHLVLEIDGFALLHLVVQALLATGVHIDGHLLVVGLGHHQGAHHKQQKDLLPHDARRYTHTSGRNGERVLASE